MLHEKDLPRSDCGAALVERIVEAQKLSGSPSIDGTIQLAECPEYRAWYFPDQPLTELNTRSGGNQFEGAGDTP